MKDMYVRQEECNGTWWEAYPHGSHDFCCICSCSSFFSAVHSVSPYCLALFCKFFLLLWRLFSFWGRASPSLMPRMSVLLARSIFSTRFDKLGTSACSNSAQSPPAAPVCQSSRCCSYCLTLWQEGAEVVVADAISLLCQLPYTLMRGLAQGVCHKRARRRSHGRQNGGQEKNFGVLPCAY